MHPLRDRTRGRTHAGVIHRVGERPRSGKRYPASRDCVGRARSSGRRAGSPIVPSQERASSRRRLPAIGPQCTAVTKRSLASGCAHRPQGQPRMDQYMYRQRSPQTPHLSRTFRCSRQQAVTANPQAYLTFPKTTPPRENPWQRPPPIRKVTGSTPVGATKAPRVASTSRGAPFLSPGATLGRGPRTLKS